MGCSQSIVENDEMQEKFKERKERFYNNKRSYMQLLKSSELLGLKIKQVITKEEIDILIYDEGRNIYENDLSREEGKQALYLLATKELLLKSIKSNVNLHSIINQELLNFESLIEEDDFEYVEELSNKLNLCQNENVICYSAKIFNEQYINHVIDNLKYENIFYLSTSFLYLVKSDLQNSQRMIDLGEIIDLNPNIKNLLVYLEPVLTDDYIHSKSKHHQYKANCSNLSYFFDAIRISPTMVTLTIICDQRVGMKLTSEALDKFFEIFIQAKCNIRSLVLINFDIKENELHRFNEIFKYATQLKYFIYQPPWPTDVVLNKISEALKFSKSLEFFVFFHGRKCSDDEIDKVIKVINIHTNIKKAFFEDNYFYLKSVKNQNPRDKMPNSLNFILSIN